MTADKSIDILLIENDLNDAQKIISALNDWKLTEKILHVNDSTDAVNFIFGKGKFKGRDTSYQPRMIIANIGLDSGNTQESLQMILEITESKGILLIFGLDLKAFKLFLDTVEGAERCILRPESLEKYLDKLKREIERYAPLFKSRKRE